MIKTRVNTSDQKGSDADYSERKLVVTVTNGLNKKIKCLEGEIFCNYGARQVSERQKQDAQEKWIQR